MAALSQFLSHLCTTTLVFFTILLLELVILVRSVAENVGNSKNRLITTRQYLQLIKEKNPVSRYNRGLRTEPIECAVCLSELEEGEEIRKLRYCNHTFHKVCLDKWLQQDRDTCPLCRMKVLPEELVNKFYGGQRRSHLEYDGSAGELIFLLSALQGRLAELKRR